MPPHLLPPPPLVIWQLLHPLHVYPTSTVIREMRVLRQQHLSPGLNIPQVTIDKSNIENFQICQYCTPKELKTPEPEWRLTHTRKWLMSHSTRTLKQNLTTKFLIHVKVDQRHLQLPPGHRRLTRNSLGSWVKFFPLDRCSFTYWVQIFYEITFCFLQFHSTVGPCSTLSLCPRKT